MAVSTPDWLALRQGELRESKNQQSYVVYFDNEPQYLVIPVPAGGKFACRVSQTINGKRLDSAQTYPSEENAVLGGLQDLRTALGW